MLVIKQRTSMQMNTNEKIENIKDVMRERLNSIIYSIKSWEDRDEGTCNKGEREHYITHFKGMEAATENDLKYIEFMFPSKQSQDKDDLQYKYNTGEYILCLRTNKTPWQEQAENTVPSWSGAFEYQFISKDHRKELTHLLNGGEVRLLSGMSPIRGIDGFMEMYIDYYTYEIIERAENAR